MREQVHLIRVPRLGVNDEVTTVTEWHVADRQAIRPGDVLCSVETAKASYDVESDLGGYVLRLAAAGEAVAVTAPIALVVPDPAWLDSEEARGWVQDHMPADDRGKPQATHRALVLSEQLGIDLAALSVEGIIREADVRRAYEARLRPAGDGLIGALTWDPARLPVAIYGAGRGGVTVKECLESGGTYQPVCFLDDGSLGGSTVAGLPVISGALIAAVAKRGVGALALAIADARIRLRLYREAEKEGFHIISIIHPRAYLAPSASIGGGSYIKAGAVIDTNTLVGDCCIIDNGAMVAHDNVIGEGCHLAPGAVLGSGITIGPRTVVGIGASVSTKVTVGRDVIIAPGASVVTDIPDASVVEGVPGRVVGRTRS